MTLAVAVDVRWETVVLIGAVVAALGYGIKVLRSLAQGLQRWDSIPAMAENVAEIARQVVPPDDGNGIPLPPLHERVAVLELAVTAIRREMATTDDLTEHTKQDGENFGALDKKLDEITVAVEDCRPTHQEDQP